jgi:SAM-dependent methyltransferase
MRDSGMNAWVGGVDPEAAGESSAQLLLSRVDVDDTMHVMDFGVGIGRVALALLRRKPGLARLTGVDIVPSMAEFCRATIGANFPNTAFELLGDANHHYDQYKGSPAAAPLSREAMTAKLGGSQDLAYAFSVFTHIDKSDFAPLLNFVAGLLKPGGRLLFTAFALTPHSREMIAKRKTVATFPRFRTLFEDGGEVFIGSRFDRLSFIAYDLDRLKRMIAEAGLEFSSIEHGVWSGGIITDTYQDVIVCRKRQERSA